jgi:hypothetical protein
MQSFLVLYEDSMLKASSLQMTKITIYAHYFSNHI